MTEKMLIAFERMKHAQQVSCKPLNMDMCRSQNKANYLGMRKSRCERWSFMRQCKNINLQFKQLFAHLKGCFLSYYK